MNQAAASPLAHYFGAVLEPAVSPPPVESATDHARARAVLLVAWRQTMRREPTLPEIQGVQAVALHETGYGRLGRFGGSHNWGAVQIPGTSGATECKEGLLGRDSHPKPDGTSETKSVCFRTYPDDVAGASDLVRNLTTRRPKTLAALATGDPDQIAAAMYVERYYEGHGATMTARVAGYAKALALRAAQVAKGLGEPLAIRRIAPSGGGTESHSLALPLAALFGVVAFKTLTAGESEEDVRASGTPPIEARTSTPLFSEATAVGDILPTVVTADDARRYVNETDTDFERLEQAIQASTVSMSFKQGWAIDLAGWRKFRDDALRNVGFFNAKATMEQTDRWKKKASDWHDSFSKEGGTPVGPPPIAPAQGTPPSPAVSAGWIQLVAMIAGLIAFGYIVRGFRGVTA